MRFIQFIKAAGIAGVSLMTGGILSFAVGFIEHLSGQSFRAVTYTIVGCAAFMAGAFLAWRNERIKLEEEEKKRGRPEITVDFASEHCWPAQLPTTNLVLNNSSSSAAVDVHIDDIRHGERVLRFRPPSAIPNDRADHKIPCGILCNGWKETNDVMTLILTENSVPLNLPTFRLNVKYSNQDATKRHWILSGVFWYDHQQQRLILNGQTIQELK